MTGGYLCDDCCLDYKSSKNCFHTVAAALKNGTISGFIQWYQTLKCKPNFTKLPDSGKPTTAGQKPKHNGAPKKVTKKVQNILASASEDSFDNRARLTGSSVCATTSIQYQKMVQDHQMWGQGIDRCMHKIRAM